MKIEISKTCPFCKKKSIVEVDEKQFSDWENGMLAQKAFPQLTAADREVLISGMCKTCQSEFFC